MFVFDLLIFLFLWCGVYCCLLLFVISLGLLLSMLVFCCVWCYMLGVLIVFFFVCLGDCSCFVIASVWWFCVLVAGCVGSGALRCLFCCASLYCYIVCCLFLLWLCVGLVSDVGVYVAVFLFL